MKINPYKYPFIAIDGMDDSGKTTLINELVKWNKTSGIGAVFTKEPTDGKIGRKIRKILQNNCCDENGEKVRAVDLQRLYIQDRYVHREIEVGILKSHPIITDRDIVSTFGHGVGEGVDLKWIFSSQELILGELFFVPDLTLILDLPAEEAVKRSQKAGKVQDYFEQKIELRNKIRKAYLDFPAMVEKFYPNINMNIQIIDASPAVENVLDKSLFWIKKYFYDKLGAAEYAEIFKVKK